jgi:hypothetical protein
MALMRVFHGSNIRIERIDLAMSEYFKDFGRGFYVTSVRKHAEERAADTARKKKMGEPVVTEFKYLEHYPDTVGLSVMRFPAPSEDWVKFVAMNRNPDITHPAHSFDIVEGPIADDKMVFQIKEYFLGKITIETLIKRLTYKEPTHQICFCTIESLYALERVENKEFQLELDKIFAEITGHIVKMDNMTEKDAADMFFASATYVQLATENTLLWQRPWEEIYAMFKKESHRAD